MSIFTYSHPPGELAPRRVILKENVTNTKDLNFLLDKIYNANNVTVWFEKIPFEVLSPLTSNHPNLASKNQSGYPVPPRGPHAPHACALPI